jgi:hypothetical protein
MRFRITPRGMKTDGDRWTLEIRGDYLVVIDADGKNRAESEGLEVLDRIRTPSFLQNRPTYGVMCRGQWVDFQASPEARVELQALLDRAYLRKHPDAGSRAVMIGLGKAAGGLVMIAVAVGLTIRANMAGPSRPVWFMGMVIGAVLCVQGLYQASTSGKWRRVAADAAERRERRRRKEPIPEDEESPPKLSARRAAARESAQYPRRYSLRLVAGSLGIALGAIALIAFSLAVYNYFEERDSYNWPKVTGEMVEVQGRKAEGGDPTRYRLWMLYRYEVDGYRYSGHDLGPDPEEVDEQTLAQLKEQFAPGTAVEIHYSPNRPMQSMIHPGVSDIAVYFVLVPFGFLLIGVGMVAFGFWPLSAKRAGPNHDRRREDFPSENDEARRNDRLEPPALPRKRKSPRRSEQ